MTSMWTIVMFFALIGIGLSGLINDGNAHNQFLSSDWLPYILESSSVGVDIKPEFSGIHKEQFESPAQDQIELCFQQPPPEPVGEPRRGQAQALQDLHCFHMQSESNVQFITTEGSSQISHGSKSHWLQPDVSGQLQAQHHLPIRQPQSQQQVQHIDFHPNQSPNDHLSSEALPNCAIRNNIQRELSLQVHYFLDTFVHQHLNELCSPGSNDGLPLIDRDSLKSLMFAHITKAGFTNNAVGQFEGINYTDLVNFFVDRFPLRGKRPVFFHQCRVGIFSLSDQLHELIITSSKHYYRIISQPKSLAEVSDQFMNETDQLLLFGILKIISMSMAQMNFLPQHYLDIINTLSQDTLPFFFTQITIDDAIGNSKDAVVDNSKAERIFFVIRPHLLTSCKVALEKCRTFFRDRRSMDIIETTVFSQFFRRIVTKASTLNFVQRQNVFNVEMGIMEQFLTGKLPPNRLSFFKLSRRPQLPEPLDLPSNLVHDLLCKFKQGLKARLSLLNRKHAAPSSSKSLFKST